jgi:NTE family protein
MPYHFRNLIFEGGGVKGVAYVGALQVLEEKKILGKIKRVGGTSAGAINALLLGLDFKPKRTKEILMNLNLRRFLDDSFGIIRDTNRLINEYGWYKGDFFRKWIGDIIEEKTGNSETTFGDISPKNQNAFKEMFFVGTNLSTGFSEVFSHEHTPRICIADAVRISMSIPFFFVAKRSVRGDVYVDGGVLNNYPVKLFDREKYSEKYYQTPEYYQKHNDKLVRDKKHVSKYIYNQETLGFRLDSAKEIAFFRDQAEPDREKIDDLFSYTFSLVKTLIEFQSNNHLHSDDWQRSIYIDTLGVKTTDFDIDNNIKNKLIKSGREGTEKYFEWYDNKESKPANRP